MPKQLLRGGLLALTVLLFAAAPAGAAIRYASPTGTGPVGTCASGDPCSIANALNNANLTDGDEVILSPGDYMIGETALDISKSVDVHGQGVPWLTRIFSTKYYVIWMANAGAKLRNLEINQSVGSNQAVALNNGTLDRVIVKSQAGSACTFSNGTIRDSFLISHRAGGWGVGTNTSGGGPYNLVLRNVTTIGAGSSNSHGIYASLNTAGTMTIDAKGVIARGTPNSPPFSYAIYASGSGGATSTVTLDHSNFNTALAVGTSSITSNAVSNNQSAAPSFVDAAGDDYHQATGSVTIDAGTTDGSSGATDVDGDARTINSTADIGGDEYSPAAPAAPSITSPPDGTVSTDATPAVTGTAPLGTFVTIYANGNPVGTATTDLFGSWNHTLAMPLADGDFSLTAVAANANALGSASSNARSLSVDTTAPAIAITAPAAGAVTGDNTPAISFSVTDAHPGVTTCQVDGGAAFGCASGDSLAPLADGSHTLAVLNTDTLDNAGSANVTFTVDTDPPETTIAKKPKRRSTKRKAKFTFTADEAGATFKCKLDKGAYKTCKSPYSKRVKRGKHTLRVIATDLAGNPEPNAAVYRWRVL